MSTLVYCKTNHCEECGRLVGDGCRRLVLHRHKLYDLERGAVCGACWVVTQPPPDVGKFSMTFGTRARALGYAP